MYIVFYRTNDVFVAEEKLQEKNIKAEVVPTPVQDKAYCGVCIQVYADSLDDVKAILFGMEYQVVD